MPEIIETREAWLEEATTHLRDDFRSAALRLPDDVRVSVGFPSKSAMSRRGRAVGQCWDGAAASDSVAQVYISPLLDDPVDVLSVLVHELVHAAVGCVHGHKGPFKRGMQRIGLEGKPTATIASTSLVTRLQRLARTIGAFPHARLTPTDQHKKQTTRLLKVTCDPCAYVCRVTRKMLDEMGAPICPSCDAAMTEATGDAPRQPRDV